MAEEVGGQGLGDGKGAHQIAVQHGELEESLKTKKQK